MRRCRVDERNGLNIGLGRWDFAWGRYLGCLSFGDGR